MIEDEALSGWQVPPAAHKSMEISISKFTYCIKNSFGNADKFAKSTTSSASRVASG